MTRRVFAALFALALVASVPGPERVASEVLDVAPTGFTVREVRHLSAPPEKVWSSLVERVGAWWDPSHTWSGDAKNLSIDARPGGCFCERLPDGGVEHQRVIFVAKGKVLRMVGGLGPLQELALLGTTTWTLAAKDGGTELTLTYAVGGHRAGGFETISPLVDQVLAEQIDRLKRHVETGRPTAATPIPSPPPAPSGARP